MKTVALYAADQDPRTTTTLGVYRYTASLIAGMAAQPDPGFRMVLWVASCNAADFVPRTLPRWMRARVLPGAYGVGWRRLLADHVLPVLLALRDRADLVHYPKGWMPCVGPWRTAAVLTLHDAITAYYCEHYPVFARRRSRRYFHGQMLRAARRAGHVLTVSQASADALTALVPTLPGRMTVAASAGMEDPPPAGVPRADHLLVFGATQPHKATLETLQRLDAYARHYGRRYTVVVTGLSGLHALPGAAPPQALDLRFEGRVPRARLEELLATSRALVFLSHVEGLGLPLLEAYARRTPVCYRNVSSMREVMAGAPGGWDGVTDKSFFEALNATLALSPAEIETIRQSLAQRFNFRDTVAKTVAVYRQVLGLA